MCVHVGPGVLGLALLQQDVGCDLEQVGHQFEHGVVGQPLESKLALAHVARVCLPEHSMAIARHNLVGGGNTTSERLCKDLLLETYLL